MCLMQSNDVNLMDDAHINIKVEIKPMNVVKSKEGLPHFESFDCEVKNVDIVQDLSAIGL